MHVDVHSLNFLDVDIFDRAMEDKARVIALDF